MGKVLLLELLASQLLLWEFDLNLEPQNSTANWGYMGIMENKMETTIVSWDYMGIMDNKMEATSEERPEPLWEQYSKVSYQKSRKP